MTCHARQYSDQMICGPCGLQWDVNDTDAPRCGQQEHGRIIIGLAGRKGAGKDTAAAPLADMGFTNVKMAGALKEMLRAYLRYRRCPDDMIERMIDGDLKEQPSRYLNGRSPRHAMQTLGTEWGRDMMSKRFWIDAVVDHAQDLERVVITDIRKANEVDFVKQELGGTVIRIERPGQSKADTHSSETEIDTLPVDATLYNSTGSAAAFMGIAKSFFMSTIARLT